MRKPKSKTAAVTALPDHEVIVPPTTLKKAIGTRRPGVVEPDPIKLAEEALAELSQEFTGWMEQELERLEAARSAYRDAQSSDDRRQALFRAAHDIRGQAETFGFPLAAPVADSLCRLLEFTPDAARIPRTLVDQHVNAIRAIVHEDAGEKGALARTLVARLKDVTDEFLVAENRDRPEVLEIVAGPPLAPQS